MSKKDEEIRFVGQPILKQILKLIDAVNIKGLINNHLVYIENRNGNSNVKIRQTGTLSRAYLLLADNAKNPTKPLKN